MARQVDVAWRSLRRCTPVRKTSISTYNSHRLFYSSFPMNLPKTPPVSPSVVHESLVTTLPNHKALQRMRSLLQQPHRRVLFLTGSSAVNSSVRKILENESPAFELERHGHGIFGVCEFCQLLLRESGRERRIFNSAQLMALILHNGIALAGNSTTSTLQRRKGVHDLLQLFRLLEQEGVNIEQYEAVAATSSEQLSRELASMYRRYHNVLSQQNVTSWDGLVLEMLELCGVQRDSVTGQEIEFSRSAVQAYTDVVVDDVHRMTSAMARLIGHLCAQESVQSSASFSSVLLDNEQCSRTLLLKQQLEMTASCIGREHQVTHCVKSFDKALEKRTKRQMFAKQVLTSNAKLLGRIECPVPLQCLKFDTYEAEVNEISTFLSQKRQSSATIQATVLCPSNADVHRIAMGFRNQGLSIQIPNPSFAATTNARGGFIHLFDEPGVNAVYSLLCALCFPSDSRHLYNVLRSDYVDLPAELLSWLMEKNHQSHANLFVVLETFIQSHEKTFETTSQLIRKDKVAELPKSVALAIENGFQKASSFITLMKQLRDESHQLSTVEIVHRFLQKSGKLEAVLCPSSVAQEHESSCLADFLRELEMAQSIVKSEQLTFVVPYLQHLRETALTSSTSREDTLEHNQMNNEMGRGCIRVLPLTKHALESAMASKGEEEDSHHVLIFMSMRDSKFPGRMKRLTLPLPYELLRKPFPVQTRSHYLEQCERLVYEALMRVEYTELVLSYTNLVTFPSSKRESLSRIFHPLWNQNSDSKAIVLNRNSQDTESNDSNVSSKDSIRRHLLINQDQSDHTFSTTLSKVMDRMYQLIKRMLLSSSMKRSRSRENELAIPLDQKQEIETPHKESPAYSNKMPHSRARVVTTFSHEPSHLSYSQIATYQRCPHRYYLGRIMKLNGNVSTSMMYGSALHAAVAAFATYLAQAQRHGKITEEIKTLAAAKATKAFEQSWSQDGYGLFVSEEQAFIVYERGLNALNEFMGMHFWDTQLKEIVCVEQAFSFHVSEANVELRGVWDRVDLVLNPIGDGTSSFVVKEFKSNMGGTQRNMQKLAIDSLQLKLYMYALRQVYGETPNGATLQQIGGYQSDRIKTESSPKVAIEKGFVPFSDKVEQEAIDAIVDVASSLRRGNFEARPSFAECAFCPYAQSACHFATDEARQLAKDKVERIS